MRKLICTFTILILTGNLSPAQSTRQSGGQKPNKESKIGVQPQASGSNAVIGSGSAGRLSKWTGVDGANSFTLGNSIVFEDKFGKLGIGTTTPTSVLTVRGMIETTLGGYKFPDGTVQTTAGLASVFHDATLRGNGTSAAPLGVAVPLVLRGDVTLPGTDTPVLFISNTSSGGNALQAFGGLGDPFGGVGVFGGGGGSSTRGGTGVAGRGGLTGSGISGAGLAGLGGDTNSGVAGPGVIAVGGLATQLAAGDGVVATGGRSNGDSEQARAGNGVTATGGNQTGQGPAAPPAGHGIQATGGNSNERSGGDGVRATGGDSVNNFPGVGVRATGGTRPDNNVGGDGLIAIGGNGTNPGNGIRAFGGVASGAGNTSGVGILASSGNVANGATRGHAGVFVGDVEINGNLNVTGSKNFKIDHPLDPENKYLVHAAIESSEVLNVYSGNVTTDGNGDAVVTLPDWFEAVNKDLRYQLTVIGTFAQAIVAARVRQNRFVIRTNAANVEVSWQVTGVRSDAAMQAQPFQTEEVKPGRERAIHLRPAAHGQPGERGVEQTQKHGKPLNR